MSTIKGELHVWSSRVAHASSATRTKSDVSPTSFSTVASITLSSMQPCSPAYQRKHARSCPVSRLAPDALKGRAQPHPTLVGHTLSSHSQYLNGFALPQRSSPCQLSSWQATGHVTHVLPSFYLGEISQPNHSNWAWGVSVAVMTANQVGFLDLPRVPSHWTSKINPSLKTYAHHSRGEFFYSR